MFNDVQKNLVPDDDLKQLEIYQWNKSQIANGGSLMHGISQQLHQLGIAQQRTLNIVEKAVIEKDLVIRAKDSVINEKDFELREKDTIIMRLVQEKDDIIQEKDQIIREKDELIKNMIESLINPKRKRIK